MKITQFKATWLENLILNNLPIVGEGQIMMFSRSKLGPKLKEIEWTPWKSSWATFLFLAISFFFLRRTWSVIARTKWGVYNCPSLHISENQNIVQRPKTLILSKNHLTLKHDSHSFILHFFHFFFFIFFLFFLIFFYFFGFFFISFVCPNQEQRRFLVLVAASTPLSNLKTK